MSERRVGRTVRRLVVWLCCGMTMAGAAGAQSAAEYRQQLDQLMPEWRAARAAVEAGERARRVTARSVTIVRGNLRIIADSSIAHRAADAAEIAAARIDSTFGANARLLADHPIVASRTAVMRGGDTTRLIRVQSNGREQTVTLEDETATRAQFVAALEGILVVESLHLLLDDTLRTWFGSPLPASGESSDERQNVYVELVTASTRISQGCLAGEMLRCHQMLGIAPIPDPLLDGYTASQRRTRVATNVQRLRTPGQTAQFDRCVAEGDDAACVARLRDLPVDDLVRWTSNTDARRSFARWVLWRGGADAYATLVATRGQPLSDRFAAAGGMPADSLVATWRTHVLSARPARPSVTPATALATLAWICACGALALRSSRWR